MACPEQVRHKLTISRIINICTFEQEKYLHQCLPCSQVQSSADQ